MNSLKNPFASVFFLLLATTLLILFWSEVEPLITLTLEFARVR